MNADDDGGVPAFLKIIRVPLVRSEDVALTRLRLS